MKKKNKDQGYFIAMNEVRRNTPEAEATWMGYTDGACCGDKVEDMVRFLHERQRGK